MLKPLVAYGFPSKIGGDKLSVSTFIFFSFLCFFERSQTSSFNLIFNSVDLMANASVQ